MTVDTSFLRSLALAQEAALQEFGIKVITDVAAADEPITLEDAYDHLHIDSDSFGSIDDTWLAGQIIAAREYCENYLGRALAPRTMELATSTFPTVALSTPPGAAFSLRFGPVTAIVSVSYADEDGEAQTFVDSSDDPLYEIDDYVTPARLIPLYGETWPTAQASLRSVKVRYQTGYVKEADSNNDPVLPQLARSAMLLVLGCAYAEREGKDFEDSLNAAHWLLDRVPNRERLGFA